MNMLLKIRQNLHISMIKKNKNGLTDRFVEHDRYVAAQKYQKVKTYSEFIHNLD